MIPVVAASMFLVLPVLIFSWRAARRGQYGLHRRLQLGLGAGLAVVIIAFELDMRLNGWTHKALGSPFYDTWLFPFLYFHVTIAITTTVLWIAAVVHGLKKMGNPPAPGAASAVHKRIGRAAAIFTMVAAVTGWTFYWMAFLA